MTNPLALADALSACVQTYPQLSEDEPGGYCTDTDMLMDQAAALLRTQHAEIERKDALLRQALNWIRTHPVDGFQPLREAIKQELSE